MAPNRPERTKAALAYLGIPLPRNVESGFTQWHSRRAKRIHVCGALLSTTWFIPRIGHTIVWVVWLTWSAFVAFGIIQAARGRK